MKLQSQQEPVDHSSGYTPRVLVVDLARNIILHGPQPGQRITILAKTRLYSHTEQGVSAAITDAFQGSFATSGLRFGVAMLIGIDPLAPPDDVEHRIDIWLQACVVFNTVLRSEIGDGQEGFLFGMLTAWVSEHGSVKVHGRV